MNYADILANELNDIVKAQDEIERLQDQWFVKQKEKKIKLLQFYIQKKKILREEMERYFKKLEYGK